MGHPISAPVLAAVGAFALGGVLNAQAPSNVQWCVDWVEDGGRAEQRRLNAVVAAGDAETLVVVVAAMAEDESRTAAARGRATELVIATLQLAPFVDFSDGAQQVVARAIAHATTDPGLSPTRRGFAIAASAQLTGREERLGWLLDGQARLRTYLDPRLQEARPPGNELPGILAYFERLGPDGVGALDVLLELSRAAALPADHRHQLWGVLDELSRHASLADRARILTELLGRYAQGDPGPLRPLRPIGHLLERDPWLVRAPIVAAVIPAVLARAADEFTAPGAPLAEPWADVILTWLTALPAGLGPALDVPSVDAPPPDDRPAPVMAPEHPGSAAGGAAILAAIRGTAAPALARLHGGGQRVVRDVALAWAGAR